MASHWILRDTLSALRAVMLRASTRHGYTISDQPAFDPETAAWFEERIKTLRYYVEYGSGASTLLTARKGAAVISMESDPRFADAVRRALSATADVTILDAKLGPTQYWGYPVFTRPNKSRHAVWLRYVKAPVETAQMRGWQPELVLVDGRFRCACALAAAQSLIANGAKGQILFDDYSVRSCYSAVEKYLGAPTLIGRSALFSVPLPGAQATEAIDDGVIEFFARDFR